MPVVSLRPCAPADADVLAQVGRNSFYQAYADTSDPHDMERYLLQHFTPQQVLTEMAEPGCAYWLLELDTRPAGYAKMRTLKTIPELEPHRYIELQRMYVLAAHWGQGYGDTLMQQCINHARHQCFEWIWLGVWKENHRAVRFYRSWGFEVVGSRQFDFAGVPHLDHVMALRIEE